MANYDFSSAIRMGSTKEEELFDKNYPKINLMLITALLKCLPNIIRSELPNHRQRLEHALIFKANFISILIFCNDEKSADFL